MTKTTIATMLPIEEGCVVSRLQEATRNLGNADGEIILDFSSVRRIDPIALRALDELVSLADGKAVKIGLRGVNVDIYKVLKLVKLTPRFFFLN